MDPEGPEIIEQGDEEFPELEVRLAELKLMELSIADLDEVSRGQSSIAILD